MKIKLPLPWNQQWTWVKNENCHFFTIDMGEGVVLTCINRNVCLMPADWFF